MFTKKVKHLVGFIILTLPTISKMSTFKYNHNKAIQSFHLIPPLWERFYVEQNLAHTLVSSASSEPKQSWNRIMKIRTFALPQCFESTELYLKTSAITDVKDFDALVMMSLLLNWQIIFFWQRGFFSANILNQKVEKPIMLAIRFWDRSRRLRLLPGGMTMLSIFTSAFELVSPEKLYV